MRALSIMIIDLSSGNGLHNGMTCVPMNSSNNSAVYEP